MTAARAGPRAGGQDDLGVTGGIAFLQPGQQRGPEVEIQVFVIVHQLHGAAHGIVNAGVGVGNIAFAGYALIPVVIGVSRVNRRDLAGPGILPGWLIKVSVNHQVNRHIIVDCGLKIAD